MEKLADISSFESLGNGSGFCSSGYVFNLDKNYLRSLGRDEFSEAVKQYTNLYDERFMDPRLTQTRKGLISRLTAAKHSIDDAISYLENPRDKDDWVYAKESLGDVKMFVDQTIHSLSSPVLMDVLKKYKTSYR